jgi:mannose-1-phosphate guanylyltransferase/phosphomannomutase
MRPPPTPEPGEELTTAPVDSTTRDDPVTADRVLTVPNAITFVRLLLIPVFVWLLFGRDNEAAAAVLLAVLGATDWVDGFLARRWQQVSTVGKILDPTADRLLLAVGVISILIDGSVPVWIAVLTFLREGLVAVTALTLAGMGARRIDVTWAGKAGTFGLMFAYPFFLAGNSTLSWATPPTCSPTCAPSRPRLQLLVGSRLRAARPPGAPPGAGGEGGPRVKAVIMAGGEGTRLRPLTSNQPKPMIPLGNRPMMEHIVRLLHRHGFDDIVVTVAFLANSIRTYFGDGSEFGVRMVYATEETPLGTAGSVRNARDELDERFLVISGDVLTDIDLSAIVDRHVERGALATIGLTAVENPLEFGIVVTDEDGAVERFLEKPSWGQVFSDTVNNGIFVLEPQIFDHIPAGGPSTSAARSSRRCSRPACGSTAS